LIKNVATFAIIATIINAHGFSVSSCNKYLNVCQ